MRLSRGSGVEGLSGIRTKNDFLIRPLLPFFKEELVVYAKTNRLKWREDVSNNSTKYLRNNIRHNVMPSFLALSSQTAANTLESVQHLQETFDAISAHFLKESDGKRMVTKSMFFLTFGLCFSCFC